MPTYIRNISTYLLPRCVAGKNKKGFTDLRPGEVGILPEGEVSKAIKIWKEQNRIVEITEKEFLSSTSQENVQETSPVTAKRIEDGTVVLAQTYDEIPKAESIFIKPTLIAVDNDGKGIAISAPSATDVLDAPAEGNPIQTSPKDLAPKLLTSDYHVIDAPESVKGKVTVADGFGDTPTEKNPVLPEVVSEAKPTVTVDEVVALKAWRQQEKAIRDTTSSTFLREVSAKTTFAIIKKICAEKIEKLGS